MIGLARRPHWRFLLPPAAKGSHSTVSSGCSCGIHCQSRLNTQSLSRTAKLLYAKKTVAFLLLFFSVVWASYYCVSQNTWRYFFCLCMEKRKSVYSLVSQFPGL